MSSGVLANAHFRANSNAPGELTFLRAGPMSHLAEAIAWNDGRAVASLLPTVEGNDPVSQAGRS